MEQSNTPAQNAPSVTTRRTKLLQEKRAQQQQKEKIQKQQPPALPQKRKIENQNNKKKIKKKTTQPPSESESESESGSENEDPPAKDQPDKVIPTFEEYYAKFMTLGFSQTRFPDHNFLRELGLHDDVQSLFTNMGLGHFFTMEAQAYQQPTCEFLASLKFRANYAKNRAYGDNGNITFQVGGQQYELSLLQVSDIYGFERGNLNKLKIDPKEAAYTWDLIGVGVYEGGGNTKASKIRNPAVRYAQKVLASTFYARQDNSKISASEMIFLIEGMKPILKTFKNGEKIEGVAREVSIAAVFINQLLKVRDWGWTTKTVLDKIPILSIGGVITPILEYCKIDVGRCPDPILRIDATCLNLTHFLVGCAGHKHVYRFYTAPKVRRNILLPKQDITSIDSRDYIIFMPSEESLYNACTDQPIVARYKAQRGKEKATANPSHQDISQAGPSHGSEPPQDPYAYGNERFYFQPFEGPFTSNALRHAHEHIKLLLQWNKVQDEAINELKKELESLKGMVKPPEEQIQEG